MPPPRSVLHISPPTWGGPLPLPPHTSPYPDSCLSCLCGADGDPLVCCSYCGHAAHRRCINEPPMAEVPGGDWSCAGCNARHAQNEAAVLQAAAERLEAAAERRREQQRKVALRRFDRYKQGRPPKRHPPAALLSLLSPSARGEAGLATALSAALSASPAAGCCLQHLAALFDAQAASLEELRKEAAREAERGGGTLPGRGDLVWAVLGGWGAFPGRVERPPAAEAKGKKRGREPQGACEIEWFDGSFNEVPAREMWPFLEYYGHFSESAPYREDVGWQEGVRDACGLALSGLGLGAGARRAGGEILGAFKEGKRFKLAAADFGAFLRERAGVEMAAGAAAHYRLAGERVAEPALFELGEKVCRLSNGLPESGKVEKRRGSGDAVEFKLAGGKEWVPQLQLLPHNAAVARILDDAAFFLGKAEEGGEEEEEEDEKEEEQEEDSEDSGEEAPKPAQTRVNGRLKSSAKEDEVISAIDAHDPVLVDSIFGANIGLEPTPKVLHYAIRSSTTPVVLALLEHVKTPVPKLDGMTLLHAATALGAREKVGALLKAGAEVTERVTIGEHLGATALHIAASKGNAPLLGVLLGRLRKETKKKQRATVDLYDSNGFTALHWCTQYRSGSAPCAELLLDAGANIDLEDKAIQKRTTMWWASTNEQCELIQLLDKRGASRDYSSRPGFKSDISSGISCTKVPIEPRPKGAGFRGFRPFVFVERSIGNPRGNRMCCDHSGLCSTSNDCPCAKKNSERFWEPYDKEGRLNASEREHESKIIYECTDDCRCSHEECLIGKVRRGIVKELAVKWAGEKKGWGVFAAEDIYKGEFVVAYAGEVLDREEMERRERERSGKGVVDTYLMQVTKEWSIDGTSVGNVSRLVNHSCDPNLVHRKVDAGNKCPTVAFFANGDIAKGTELTWSYTNRGDKKSWSDSACFCGAKNCRGKL
ncbi:hypothetical protein TeGR_g4039 [Tetraparma gracilis]|uniref:Uncharacterized protein n=1 Tax=Tetraparma gracilis TaxID=2962635 RepID=A0ABQ6MC96_9STRA|nr:hypothetical protein TeGR_g4039 [Tetraparma gracilis]